MNKVSCHPRSSPPPFAGLPALPTHSYSPSRNSTATTSFASSSAQPWLIAVSIISFSYIGGVGWCCRTRTRRARCVGKRCTSYTRANIFRPACPPAPQTLQPGAVVPQPEPWLSSGQPELVYRAVTRALSTGRPEPEASESCSSPESCIKPRHTVKGEHAPRGLGGGLGGSDGPSSTHASPVRCHAAPG